MSDSLPPAIDFSITEITDAKELPARVRIIGVVVNLGAVSFTLNDGDAQLDVQYGQLSVGDLAVKQFYRIIAEVQYISGLFVFLGMYAHPMDAQAYEQYKKIVKLERRLQKSQI